MGDSSEVEKLRQALRDAQRQIQALLQHDPLTGAVNPLPFRERLDDALAWSQRLRKHFAVLLVGLDKLGNVNDTHGRKAGDQVLIETARRLRSCVREVDIVGRMGGDEFGIILQSLSGSEDVTIVCGRIIKSLSRKFETEGGSVKVGASIGVALHSDEPLDRLDELLATASREMRAAKESGGNAFRASTTMAVAGRRKGLRGLLGS